MGLPWTRVDSNIASHDKILRLITEYKYGKGSAFVYVCSLGYAAGNGTDGLVPFACLPFIHASKRDADALVECGLWHPHPLGWTIPNFAARNPTNETAKAIRAGKQRAALKGNCIRWHGPDCHCWDQEREKVSHLRVAPATPTDGRTDGRTKRVVT